MGLLCLYGHMALKDDESEGGLIVCIYTRPMLSIVLVQ